MRIKLFAGIALTMLAASSCLKDGDETISLERGIPRELVPGVWTVDNCYKLSGDGTKEEIPMDSWVGTKFSCYPEGEYVEEIKGSSEISGQYWSVTEPGDFSNPVLTLGGKTFSASSMGKSRMLLATSNKEYLVNKVSEIGDDDPGEYYSEVSRELNSGSHGKVKLNGLLIDVPKGAIPLNDNGKQGTIWFTAKKITDCPYSLPSGYSIVDKVYKCEPMGFIFQTPLLMNFDLRGNDPSKVKILHYNENNSRWDIMPFSNLNNGTAGVASLDLGYYVLARNTSQQEEEFGGICFDGSQLQSGYFYYLLIEDAPDRTLCGKMTYSGSGNLYLPFIKKGLYTVRLARERKNSTDEDVSEIQNSTTLKVRVNESLVPSLSGMEKYSGWTKLKASDFQWNSGRPDSWGRPTVTYGTGKFQATLTWVNTSSVAVDYDLHLETPDSHIFYSSKVGHCFSLDRDWLTEPGNAVENIYSTDDAFPAGNYKLYVNHYSGATGVRYNCRVLVNGYSVASYSGITGSGSKIIYEFKVEK